MRVYHWLKYEYVCVPVDIDRGGATVLKVWGGISGAERAKKN